MSGNDLENLQELVSFMKEHKLPSTDWDVLHKERGQPEWSGTEYNASAADLEVFNDDIGDNGITAVDTIGDTAEFGDGYVEITFIHEESSEDSEAATRVRAYKLDFQCEVSLLMCVFEEGETLDGIIDWTQQDYNYYDLKSGSRDPSDESHGYFEEMQGDVKAL